MIKFRSVNIPLDEYSNKFIIYHDEKQVLIKTQPEIIDCISKANEHLQEVILKRNEEIHKLSVEKEDLEDKLNKIPKWIKKLFI